MRCQRNRQSDGGPTDVGPRYGRVNTGKKRIVGWVPQRRGTVRKGLFPVGLGAGREVTVRGALCGSRPLTPTRVGTPVRAALAKAKIAQVVWNRSVQKSSRLMTLSHELLVPMSHMILLTLGPMVFVSQGI